MRISLKHEAMRAGNVSVTDIYNCSEVELRTMVERDRCLRAIRMGCSPVFRQVGVSCLVMYFFRV